MKLYDLFLQIYKEFLINASYLPKTYKNNIFPLKNETLFLSLQSNGLDGRTSISRFIVQEHAGIGKADSADVGTSAVECYS